MKIFFVKNRYPILLLLFVVLSILVSYFYIGYSPELKKDAAQYLEAANYLSRGGQITTSSLLNRVLTNPAFVYSSILINYFVKDFSSSFAVVNIIFYILLIFAFYFLALEIYKEKRVAFLGSILVAVNYYIIDPTMSHMSDMGGWFFFVFSTYWAIKYFNALNRKFYYYSVLVASIGVFFQEYGGLALVNLALLILFSNFSNKQKIKDIIRAGLLFMIPLLSWHLIFYFKYHLTYFDRMLDAAFMGLTDAETRGLILLIKIFGWLFSFGWLAFLFGVREELKIMDKNRLKILLATLPIAFLFLIWPVYTQRIAVVLMMWLSLVAGFGLSRVKWYLLYPFLGIYIWFNYNIRFLLDKINLPF